MYSFVSFRNANLCVPLFPWFSHDYFTQSCIKNIEDGVLGKQHSQFFIIIPTSIKFGHFIYMYVCMASTTLHLGAFIIGCLL